MFTKKISLIIISIILGLAVIAGTTTAIVLNIPPKTDAYNTNSSDETLTDGYIGNLLANGNTINQTTYNSLINLLGSTSGTAKASEINGGTPIIFKMGEHPTTNEPIYWQVVYKNNSHITIWMTQPYTTSRFNPSSTDSDGHLYNGNYSNSILRDTTLDIFSTLSSSSNYPILNTIISTPSTAASSWQSSQSNSYYTSTRTSITNGLGSQTSTTNPHGWSWTSCMSDKFWIPSYYEVYNNTTSSVSNSTTSYTGLWGLNSTMRGFDSNAVIGSSGSTTSCWLRSSNSLNTNYVLNVGTSGIFGHYSVYGTIGVRPAAHLSLTSLANASKSSPGFELIESRASDSAHGSVSVTPPSSTNVASSNGYYTSGTRVTITITPNSGYRLSSLKINGSEVTTTTSGSSRTYTFTITENTTYEYMFEVRTAYNLTTSVSPSGAGSVSPSGTNDYEQGTSVSITATANAGYTFTNWTVNGSTRTGNPISVTINSNTTVVANFTRNQYTLTATTSGGGTVSGSGTYYHNDTATISASANEGYHFVRWTLTSGTGTIANPESASTTITITGNATVSAEFAINTYTITTANDWHGSVSISPSGTTFNYGTQITLTASPNEHYEVDYWTKAIDGGSETNVQTGGTSYVDTVNANATYKAYFKLRQYSLTIASNFTEYGTVRNANTGATGGISGTFDALTTYSYIAIANGGYTFKFWQNSTGAIVTTSNLLDVTLTQDSTYTAVFVRASISVYATAGGEIRMNGYDGETMQPTDTIHLSAFAYAGYEFTGWTCEDGTDISAYTVNSGTGEPYLSVDLPFSLIQGKIIIANFVPINNGNINDDLNN